MAAKRVEIFKLLGGLSKKSTTFYDNLSDEEKRQVAPLVVQRWLSGTDNARQVFFLNELVNPFVFSLYKHPDLLIKLMTICTPGRFQKHQWKKALTKKKSNTPNAVRVIRETFGYNTLDAIEALPLLTNADILAYAEDLGLQPDEIRKLKAELKKR